MAQYNMYLLVSLPDDKQMETDLLIISVIDYGVTVLVPNSA
jgi:hypothetical protein